MDIIAPAPAEPSELQIALIDLSNSILEKNATTLNVNEKVSLKKL